MTAPHTHPAEPSPVTEGHEHHGHAHHGHRHDHHHAATHEHRAAPEPRFSLIALSAAQRLALVTPAIIALGLLTLWATQNG